MTTTATQTTAPPASLPTSDILAALAAVGVHANAIPTLEDEGHTLRVRLARGLQVKFWTEEGGAGVEIYLLTHNGVCLSSAILHATVSGRLVATVAAALLAEEPAPTRYGRCTVAYHGRPAEARHAELLPNGYWRVDFVSGLVGCYDEDPIANPGARQRH